MKRIYNLKCITSPVNVFYQYNLLLHQNILSHLQEFWKDKLIFKFGNARKRLDRDHPEVQARTKKNPSKSEQNSTNKDEPDMFVWGLAKYLPPLPVSEDSTSQQCNIDWLKREYRKTSSDIDIYNINKKMHLTFSLRRKKIVEDKIGIKELLETFPWLQSRQEVFIIYFIKLYKHCCIIVFNSYLTQ